MTTSKCHCHTKTKENSWEEKLEQAVPTNLESWKNFIRETREASFKEGELRGRKLAVDLIDLKLFIGENGELASADASMTIADVFEAARKGELLEG